MASIIAAGFVSLGIQDRQWLLVGASAGVVFVWWYAFYRVEKGSITLSIVLTGLACCLILLQLDDRRRFVIRNGGWEGPGGVGSPMAFLIGLMFELFWFVFFFLTTMCGLRLLLGRSTPGRPRAS